MANLLSFTPRGTPADADSVAGLNGTVAGSESRWTFATIRTWVLAFVSAIFAPIDNAAFTGNTTFESLAADTLDISGLQISGHATTFRTTATTDVTFPTSGTLATAASVAAAIAAIDLSSPTVTINDVTGSYTLVLADGSNKVIRATNASASSLIIPSHASVALPIGIPIPIIQGGAGKYTISYGGGITVRSRDSQLTTRGQYSSLILIQTAVDEWLVTGDVTEANLYLGVRNVSGNTALALADVSTSVPIVVNQTSGSASTFTVQPNSSVAIPSGAEAIIYQMGAGQITFTPGAGVTILSRGAALKTAGQYAGATLRHTDVLDTWILTGDITT